MPKIMIEIPDEDYECMQESIVGFDFTVILDAIQNAIPLEKVLEDIKKEIKEHCYYSCKEGAFYLDEALEIMDRHISRKGNE